MKKHWMDIMFVAMIIIFSAIVTYIFKYQQKEPNYKLTSVAPVVSVDDKQQIFVRTDCTIEEYRNCIGKLAQEILQLRNAQIKPVQTAKVEAPK